MKRHCVLLIKIVYCSYKIINANRKLLNTQDKSFNGIAFISQENGKTILSNLTILLWLILSTTQARQVFRFPIISHEYNPCYDYVLLKYIPLIRMLLCMVMIIQDKYYYLMISSF